MLTPIVCLQAHCDDCGAAYGENGDGVVHFDTERDALDYITSQDAFEVWTVTETGRLRCDLCRDRRICAADGHDLSAWQPCLCLPPVSVDPVRRQMVSPCTARRRRCLRCDHDESTHPTNTAA